MDPGKFYHVYNHANGDESLFREDKNYHFFLKQWVKYIEPIAATYAYCLMPNHFHFLVRTKEINPPFGKFETFQKFASKQFANLFSSYTQAYNKLYERKGSLFIPNFKRKEITSDKYLTSVFTYIHRNPIHHRFCQSLEEWSHSSVHAYFSERPTKLKREEGLAWFGGKKAMTDSHLIEPKVSDTSLLIDF
jgi:putative transposase